MFINNQKDLVAFVQRAASSPILAIDTEFLREKTYYAKLCLLQMGTRDETVIVDPFAVDDLRVLSDVLRSQTVVKLFHAGTQDIEILYRETGVMPEPVFDTQIAAALLGHTQQIGYGALVSNVCGVQLRKMDSFTDWSRRPLSKSQVEYAADDVVYLPQIYDHMMEDLQAKGRLKWLDADFAQLIDPAKYEQDDRERYKRLKRASQLNRKQLSAARELAAWREAKAKNHDIPRKWVITDEQIVEACKREACSIDELFMVRGISDRMSMKEAREVVAAIKRGLDLPRESWPSTDKPMRNEANVDIQLDVMSALVRLRARQNDIAFQTLASHSDLSEVARGRRDAEVLRGWRREIVGNELLELLDGQLTIGLEDGELKVTERQRSLGIQ